MDEQRLLSNSICTGDSHTQDLLRGAQSLVELAEGLPDIAFQLSVLEFLCQRDPVLVVGNAGLGAGAHLAVEMAKSLSDVKLTCMAEGRERDSSKGCTKDLMGCCTEASTAPSLPAKLYSLLTLCHFRAKTSASS